MAAARDLIARLDTEGRIDFDDPVPDPLLHIDYVWTKGPGRMFGVLVCSLGDGTQVVLKAFSGQMTNRWNVTGWVGPVAGVINTTPLYQQYRALTEAYSAQLASVESALSWHHHHLPGRANRSSGRSSPHPHPGAQRQPKAPERPSGTGTTTSPGTFPLPLAAERPALRPAAEGGAAAAAFLQRQRQLLHGRRRALSHELLRSIQCSYGVRNFAGEELRLLQVYDAAQRRLARLQGGAPRGLNGNALGARGGVPQLPPSAPQNNAIAGALAFPAGTGDCCAPKLLAAAARRGLAPLGLVEFWYGSPPNTATPQGRSSGGGGGGGGDAGATRVHGEFYGMCEKCEAILGSMLCGAEAAVSAGGDQDIHVGGGA